MELSKIEFEQITQLIHSLCGIVIAPGKEYLITQRLPPLVKAAGCNSFGEYCLRLNQPSCPPALREAMISAMTTNETLFFRDQHPFEAFANDILPEMAKRRMERKISGFGPFSPLNIWSAAASTGQEAYSISILIHESLPQLKTLGMSLTDFHITGTDICGEVLAKAKSGLYTNMEMSRGVDDNIRRKYFTQRGDQWAVNPSIKGIIEFKHFNLTRPFAQLGKSFDLVFCRNVLIYFSPVTSAKILDEIYQALNPGGILILGAMENTYCLSNKFKSRRIGNTMLYQK